MVVCVSTVYYSSIMEIEILYGKMIVEVSSMFLRIFSFSKAHNMFA
jgi:hypothetical protein